MDKETLSNYGWIVICVLVLAVMIALASPFGNFVANAVKSTTSGLFDVNQSALGAAGIIIDDNEFNTPSNDAEGQVSSVIHFGEEYIALITINDSEQPQSITLTLILYEDGSAVISEHDNIYNFDDEESVPTGTLKDENQIVWVCNMQNIKSRANEIVCKELIYV